MIASLFSKTRPFNYLVTAILFVLCYFLYQFSNNSENLTTFVIAKKGATFLILIASIVLVNFISLRNSLTKNDNYAILLYLIFIITFPNIFNNFQIALSNLFLLFALRRLISLKSLSSSKEKIFDASFWIFLSAVFHFWSISYILLVFISIIFHTGKDYKNWLIPFISFFCVYILYIVASLLLFDDYSLDIKQIQVNFDFFSFKNVFENMALAVFVSISALFFASQVLDYRNKPLNMQSSYKQTFFAFLLAITIYVLSQNKSNELLIYSFAPLSILGANMFEKLQDNIYKEISLYLLLFVGLFFFFVQL